ncbi:MAG: hypothetical protein AB1679_32425 [Actinomycetota bacterium]|jgi:hypothetical protein
MRHRWAYPYVSHLLLLPPEDAEVHFDLACLRLVADGRRSPTTGRPVVAVPAGRLELGRPIRPVDEPRAYRPARTLPGTLQPGRRSPWAIDVDVELLPWSATRTELALIAGPTRWPGFVSERRYLRLAHDILDVLVDALHTERSRPPQLFDVDALAFQQRDCDRARSVG